MADKQADVSTGNVRLCTAKRKDGQPCGAYAMHESRYCFSHDPGLAKARAEARAKGGRARHGRRVGSAGEVEPVTIASVGDLLALLEQTVNDLLALENSVSRGRALLSAVTAGVKVLEVGELEERIARLEEALR